MNEDTTRDLPDSRSFEERIFNYLEAMEARMKADMLEMKIVINDINRRLATLEEKVERRLYDTRPIWEGVQAQLGVMQEQISALHEQSEATQAQIAEVQVQVAEVQAHVMGIEERVMRLDGKFDVLSGELLGFRADNVIIHRRVTKLEDAKLQPSG